MDAQKFELDALSDDQLDAVSGGDNKVIVAKQTQADLQAQLQNAEDKKQADPLKGFQQMLQELP